MPAPLAKVRLPPPLPPASSAKRRISAQAAADAGLAQDHGRPHLRGAVNVGPAAQLAAEIADADDAYLRTILLAEDHQGAGLARLIERHDPPADLVILEDAAIDEMLDI